jgi:hypothetical protein
MDNKHPYAAIDTRPSLAQLAKFGATLLVAACLVGAVLDLYWHDALRARWAYGLGALALVTALTPRLGRIFYIAWLGLGISIGLVTSPLILAVLYFGVITPVALGMRLFGRDTLKRRLDRGAASYWEPYPEHNDLARYLKQF